MNRKTDYDKTKIATISTNKAVITTYVDAFEIEKLLLRGYVYESKQQIDFYIDFQELFRICSELENGVMAKTFAKGQSYSLGYKGVAKSKKYQGEPESKTGYFVFKDGKIFINLTSGKGKLTSTGAISPNGAPDTKICVTCTPEKLKELLLYSKECVRAYLPYYIKPMIEEVAQYRESVKK